MLIYDEGSFMQCLEGPAESVAEIYRIIRADPLHHNIFEMSRVPIAQREYPDWSMALRTVSGEYQAWGGDALTSKLLEGGANSSESNVLLAAFWNHGRGSRLLGQSAGVRAR